MQSFEGLSAELLRGGRGEKLRDLAASRDGAAVAGLVDAAALERAAASGDSEALRAILSRALNTAEGRRLAENVRRAMEG
jgi:hypothetical protein